MARFSLLLVALVLAPALATAQVAAPTPVFDPIVFELVKDHGIGFVTNSGRTAHRHQPETMVSGVALFDFDNDGLLDVFLTNGAKMPGLDKTEPGFWNRLYRNLGDWKFEDVTEKAGVKGHGYDNGVAAADYDEDGWTDLFVAGLRENVLWRNKGDGTFEDVTAKAGLENPDPDYGTLWAVAAAFFDYDKDGDLDLFVSNYCVWDPKTEPLCGPQGDRTTTATRTTTRGCRTRSSGTRATAPSPTSRSPPASARSSARGWASASPTSTGTAGSTSSSRTTRSPTSSSATSATGSSRRSASWPGSPTSRPGRALSGMGADARDIDDDGRPDIFLTALSSETMPLFRNQGNGTFLEMTARAGVASLSLSRAGWSCGIVDFNNDGRKDLFVAGGDVMDPNGEFREKVAADEPRHANLGECKFADATARRGADFSTKRGIHRGGGLRRPRQRRAGGRGRDRLDEPVEVWRNVSPAPNRWLAVRTVGTKSNRDGMGAEITLTTPPACATATSTRRSATAGPPTSGSTSAWARTRR